MIYQSFPKKFCASHLPKNDGTVVLVYENEEEFVVKYLSDKNGLSGGWRGFSIAHSLVKNDVLVFQLIQHGKFKVTFLKCLNYGHFVEVREILSHFIYLVYINDVNEFLHNQEKYY